MFVPLLQISLNLLKALMELIGNRVESKVTSQHIQSMGITAQSQAHYTVITDCLAYLCGSQIVIYDPTRQQQIKAISHRTYQISCLAASPDGRILAVADLLKDCTISLYDLRIEPSKLLNKPTKTIPYKRGTISHMAFSPNGKYLVTVSNDENVITTWQDGSMVAKNKVTKRINKMLFNEDGNLMTAGQQHLKIWNFNQGTVVKTMTNMAWMMEGKNVGLRKEMIDKEFVSVASRNGVTLALTADGFLCSIKEGSVFRHAYINMESASCMEIIGREVFCGGKNADVRVINVDTLQLSRSFSKPPPIGKQNIEKESQLIVTMNPNDKYPKCVGIRALGNRVVTLYENKMMFVWNILEKQIIAEKSFLGHRSEIICISLLEQISESITFFATSSLDKTIRIWHIYDECFDNLHQSVDIAAHVKIKRNVYCKNLTRIIYTQEVINYIKCFQNRLLALSKSCLYFFLLTNFEFEEALTLDAVIDSVELEGDKLYLGCEDMTIRIYQVVDANIIESAIYRIKHKIQHLLINSKQIFCLGNGKLSIISQQSKTLLKQISNVNCIYSHNKYVYWVYNNILSIHNPSQRKTKPPIQLKALLEPRTAHIIRATSSYILTAKTDETPNIVSLWDLDGKFLIEERFGEAINDIMCTEGGDTVVVGKSGAMMIWRFVYNEKVKKFKEIFKDRLAKDSLFGSVWMEDSAPIEMGARHVNFNARNAESKVIVVESPDESMGSSMAPSRIPEPYETERSRVTSSIRLKNMKTSDSPQQNVVRELDYASVPARIQEPNRSPRQNLSAFKSPGVLDINIPLKQGSKQQIFNPSAVTEQVNQILQNLSHVQNKMGWQDRRIFESTNNIDVIELGDDDVELTIPTNSVVAPPITMQMTPPNSAEPKQKVDNFFADQDCNSIQFKGSPKNQTLRSVDPFDSLRINKQKQPENSEDSIVIGFSEQSVVIQKFAKLLEDAGKITSTNAFIQTHEENMESIYKVLHQYFGKKNKQKAAKQLKRLQQQNTKQVMKILDEI